MRAAIKFDGFFLLVCLLILCGLLWPERELANVGPTVPPGGNLHIVIKTNQRILELYSDNLLYKRYCIAVGKSASPTPVGDWYVFNKAVSDKDVLGTHWLGLSVPWGSYGIHGTDKPWSIGRFASKGCIRMHNRDIEELFRWVPVGTFVRIEGGQIKIERVLKYQTAGPDVAMLQMALKKAGYFYGRADGLFGRTTEDAMRLFQQEKKLSVTGQTDSKTLNLLGL